MTVDKRIVHLCIQYHENRTELVLSEQLATQESATKAIVEELKTKKSKNKFLYQLSRAMKEANDTDYWQRLLTEGEYDCTIELKTIQKYKEELVKIIVKIQ